MTIQNRRRSSKRLSYGSDSEPDYYPSDCGQDHELAEFGLSIFREANGGQLDEAIYQIGKECPSYITRIRGEGHEIPSAINILESGEARRIIRMGNFAVQKVNDYLYHAVPSLRTTLKIDTDDVEIFGWNNSKEKTIGVTIKDPALSELMQERNDVVRGLNDIVHGNSVEECHIKQKTFHLSLARILPTTPEYVIDKTRKAVASYFLVFHF